MQPGSPRPAAAPVPAWRWALAGALVSAGVVATATTPGAGVHLATAPTTAGTRVRPGDAEGPRTSSTPAGTDPGGDQIAPDVVEEVRQAQAGNAHAFSLLYDRYVERVYAYCHHRVGDVQTAEDLTADVFMRALKRIDTFSWQGRDFGAWLLTIARNRCHDHFKSARFRLEHAVAEVRDAADLTPSTDGSPEQAAEQADLRRQVHAALGQLKPEQAEVLYHRFLQGHDVHTTALVMGKKEGAIRALQYRALKALARHVDVEALA